MLNKDKVLEYLKEYCNGVGRFPGFQWWHFVYNDYHMAYIANNNPGILRICIPHYCRADAFEPELLNEAVNETNINVRYVKVIVLDNGSVSINYDHRCDSDGDTGFIVHHILESLCFAAKYLDNLLSK